MEIESLEVREISADQWPETVQLFRDATYEQSLTYSEAAAARIGAAARFFVIETPDKNLVAAASVRVKLIPGLGRGIAWVAAGPIAALQDRKSPSAEQLASIVSALRDSMHQEGHVFRFRLPATTYYELDQLNSILEDRGFRPAGQSKSYRTVVLDLAPDEDSLMKSLHGKWRNHLRKSFKADLELDAGPIGEFASRFQKLYRQVQQAKGFLPDIPPEYYFDLNGPDFEHEVLIAKKDGVDVGAMTVGRTGGQSVYLFGATGEQGRRLNSGYFLMWHAILACKSGGVSQFDLGGIDSTTNPSVTEFKLRTGGKEIVASGPWEAIPKGTVGRFIGTVESLYNKVRSRS